MVGVQSAEPGLHERTVGCENKKWKRNGGEDQPDDLENWRTVIEDLLSDEARRIKLGKRAKEDVKGHTWLARVEKILSGF